ncbi:MAG: branched-chain amino acid ABC transporter permease [Chloroflexi bacterium]|nr:branched-chain amino acid ABC transporter permease [Chloroflexota bacterium]MBV9541936.1 branched-chain amino acid ABC transporter permease [Alphaproteobacteria bacterium]
MTLETFGLHLLNGITFGALLFLLASGFTLIFGLMHITNMSHGGLYLVGGYIGLSVLGRTGNIWMALLASAVGVGLMGLVIERALLRPVRNRVLPEVLVTLGLAFVLGDLSLAIWGGDPQTIRVPGVLSQSVSLLGLTYPVFRLFMVVVGVLTAAGLWFLQHRTLLGAIIRAGVDDAGMVDAMGVDIKLVFNRVFGLGAALAGLAGLLGGAFLALYPGADSEILLLAVVVVIIGGPGSLLGAIIGSLLVGLIDAFATALVPDLVYFTLFAPMVIILAWRPYGLLGRAT